MNKQFSCANESAADFALSPYVNCLCCSLLPCCIAECDRRKFCCNILQSMFAFWISWSWKPTNCLRAIRTLRALFSLFFFQ